MEAQSLAFEEPLPARDVSGLLTLLRHGESEWNRQRRFTGWADVGLSDNGRAEAERAGRLLARHVRPVDVCLTSMLRRARDTSRIVLETLDLPRLAIEETWRLNERHYGALQGLRAWTAVRRHGPLAVVRCRRKFRVRPPALAEDDPRLPHRDPRYAKLSPSLLPRGESMSDTLDRVVPCWEQRVLPELARGRHVLVVSHKNTLRALMRLLRRLAPHEVPPFRIANGVPLVMAFESRDGWMLGRRCGNVSAELAEGRWP